MSDPKHSSAYQQLVASTRPQRTPSKSAEADLDVLVSSLHPSSPVQSAPEPSPARDPVQALREMTVNEFVPAFVELMEKYSKAGISMQMDASSFLEGGREMKFEFCVAEHRLVLHGTVTAEGIAFHETRYTPEFHGELMSGPMLRLRSLNARTFREFICERLTALLRSAMRRKLA